MPKHKPFDEKEIEKIYSFVKEFIIKNKSFCTVKEISEGVGLSYQQVNKYINHLINSGRFKVVFRAPKKIMLVAPNDIVESLSKFYAPPPYWLSQYLFPEKLELIEQKNKLDKQLQDFEQFELLLTSSGSDLVNAVGHSLRFLGFNVTITEKEGHQDLEVSDEKYFAIIEVKGLDGFAKIKELRQVVDYNLRMREETNRDDFATILLVNHFRHNPPEERGEPFSREVLSAVKKQYRFITLMTTVSLYKAIGEAISGKSTKDMVKEKFKSGRLAYPIDE